MWVVGAWTSTGAGEVLFEDLPGVRNGHEQGSAGYVSGEYRDERTVDYNSLGMKVVWV